MQGSHRDKLRSLLMTPQATTSMLLNGPKPEHLSENHPKMFVPSQGFSITWHLDLSPEHCQGHVPNASNKGRRPKAKHQRIKDSRRKAQYPSLAWFRESVGEMFGGAAQCPNCQHLPPRLLGSGISGRCRGSLTGFFSSVQFYRSHTCSNLPSFPASDQD